MDGRLRTDAETLQVFRPEHVDFFLWGAENHPRCQLYHTGRDNHRHRGALRLGGVTTHQSYGKVS